MMGERLVLSAMASCLVLAANLAGGRATMAAAVALADAGLGCSDRRTTDDVVAASRRPLRDAVSELAAIVARLPAAPPAVRLMRLDGPVPSSTNTILVAAEDADAFRFDGVSAASPWAWAPTASPPRARTGHAVRNVVDALRAPPGTAPSSRPRVVEALERDVAQVLSARYLAVAQSAGPATAEPDRRWHGSVALFDRRAGRWVGRMVIAVRDERVAVGEGAPGASSRRVDELEAHITRTIMRSLEAGWSQPGVLSAVDSMP